MKHTKTSVLLLLTAFFLSVLFSSCALRETKFTAYSLDYFDTATTITGYAEDRAAFDSISNDILSVLGEYHRLYTIYHHYDDMENLCTVNTLENGVHRTVPVDRRITDMLLYAKDMYALTDGRMNIAMGSVLSIWHDYRTAGLDEPSAAALPSMEELSRAALHTNIDDLVIDEEAGTVFLADPDMTLDVGAIAKGYAVEMAAQMLEERGISGYVINVGGNVRTVGSKPDGSPWLAGIENPNPTDDAPYVGYLHLTGESIVTSGTYQRYYMVDGKSYHHIIDADTLFPAEGYLSISIVCKNSALGDALSTALFCMTPEDGLALVERLADVEALWILADESRQYSSGFAAYLTEP
ncbi:MAG: FAD:protein FMN transferase [Ruminococcaceae bacterium]|nr:FAD:protein FMN transferase [Oscillospiraceae bacterium]